MFNSLIVLESVVSTVVQEVGKVVTDAFDSKNFASNLVIAIIGDSADSGNKPDYEFGNLAETYSISRGFSVRCAFTFPEGVSYLTRVLFMSWIWTSCSSIKLARTIAFISVAIMTENMPLAEPTYHTPIGINSYNDYSLTNEGLATTSAK